MKATREQLAAWRAGCAEGSITRESYTEAIAALREDRFSARPAAKARAPKRRVTAKDAAAALQHYQTCKAGAGCADWDHQALEAALTKRGLIHDSRQLDIEQQILRE